MIVTTEEQLEAVVRQFSEFDEFVFDLETVYRPTAEEQERYDRVKAVAEKRRSIDDRKWLEIFEVAATDPLRNEIIWVGLAGPGGAQAVIPTGHPLGRQLTAQVRKKVLASELYEDGDPRRLTRTGKVSNRKVMATIPATFEPPPPQLDLSYVMEELRPLFFGGKRIIGHNVKFDLKTVRRHYDEFPPPPYIDTIIAQHLLNERLKDYKLETLVKKWYGRSYEKLGSKGVQNFSFRKAAKYTSQDVRYTWLLWKRFERMLERHPELRRFLDYEMDVYAAVMDMEWTGIEVDTTAVAAQRVLKEAEIERIVERLIVDYGAPPDFNPNATAQKADLLFKKHKAPVQKRTEKSGAISVDRESLEGVIEAAVGNPKRWGTAGEVAELLLAYADESKTLGTYLVGLPQRLDANRRVHPDFLLHGTETSRLSCREPNIQNIPRESEMRSMFVAPRGHAMVVADYDQIELRWIAYLSQDPAMMELFITGQDIHRGTAALVLNKPFDEVTDAERQDYGKMPNFLLGYGGSAYNLHQKTGIPVERAERVLAQYYRGFRRINPWKERVIREAKGRAQFSPDGRMTRMPYVETMLGRRRRLPELFWDDKKVRAAAERQAVNTITQGSASETTKLAMVDLLRHRERTGFPIFPIINVHDELACLVPERLAEEGRDLLVEIMREVRIPHTGERPLGDKMPLAVKGTISDRWQK